jgi:hypothetical protein
MAIILKSSKSKSKSKDETVLPKFKSRGFIELEDIETIADKYNLDSFKNKEKETIKRFLAMSEPELSRFLPKKDDPPNTNDPEVAMRREALLVMVHKLSLRGITISDMAKHLNLSMRQISIYKAKIKERLKHQVQEIDFGLFAGETMSFYREIRNMAITLASNKDVSTKDKSICINTALKAEGALHKFLERCGVFSALESNPLSEGIGKSAQKTEQSNDLDKVLFEWAASLKKPLQLQPSEQKSQVPGSVTSLCDDNDTVVIDGE